MKFQRNILKKGLKISDRFRELPFEVNFEVSCNQEGCILNFCSGPFSKLIFRNHLGLREGKLWMKLRPFLVYPPSHVQHTFVNAIN